VGVSQGVVQAGGGHGPGARPATVTMSAGNLGADAAACGHSEPAFHESSSSLLAGSVMGVVTGELQRDLTGE
jgi:hypothetical protein